MPQISVVIITYNEERNIARCLDSVKTIADEIVVIDSFSTDKTEEICKTNKVRFISHAFEGHIEQKNWAITQAGFPHILSLDADEVVSDQLAEAILEVKQNWKKDGYSFNRLTNYCGKWIKHGGWYPDRKLRLWDSRKGSWTGENPHDKYELKAGCTSGQLKGDLLHYSFNSIEDHLKQIEKFSFLAASARFKNGKRTNLFNILMKPLARFFKGYIFRMGFLDGYYGFVIHRLSMNAVFLRHIKLREMWKSKNRA
jgi:glycosyltransferase involved in cell wall biosynthesis